MKIKGAPLVFSSWKDGWCPGHAQDSQSCKLPKTRRVGKLHGKTIQQYFHSNWKPLSLCFLVCMLPASTSSRSYCPWVQASLTCWFPPANTPLITPAPFIASDQHSRHDEQQHSSTADTGRPAGTQAPCGLHIPLCIQGVFTLGWSRSGWQQLMGKLRWP